MSYGFVIIFALVIVFFSVSTGNFLSASNIVTLFMNVAPWLVMATGVSLVIMTGNIDISIGSVLFMALATGSVLMTEHGLPAVIGIPLILVLGAVAGALNGLLVVFGGINPLITTMGMMFVWRGLTLWLVTRGREVAIPQALQQFGESDYFKVAVIGITVVVLILVHLLVTRTKFGRQVMAIGNNAEVAGRLGIRVKWVLFLTYVMSGLMVCAGGILQIVQIGGITFRLGAGYEFTAIAAAVVGGISLFGGEGSIIPGLVMGGLTLVIVENGLTHLGVTPYAYPFVRGGIIFLAMYADAMKSRVQSKVQVVMGAEPAGHQSDLIEHPTTRA